MLGDAVVAIDGLVGLVRGRSGRVVLPGAPVLWMIGRGVIGRRVVVCRTGILVKKSGSITGMAVVVVLLVVVDGGVGGTVVVVVVGRLVVVVVVLVVVEAVVAFACLGSNPIFKGDGVGLKILMGGTTLCVVVSNSSSGTTVPDSDCPNELMNGTGGCLGDPWETTLIPPCCCWDSGLLLG